MLNLDEMIMDVQVSQKAPGERVTIKFLAIAGGTGPELNLSHQLAEVLWAKLHLMMTTEKSR